MSLSTPSFEARSWFVPGAWAACSGGLYFLGWPGFDLLPLAFVAFVPLLWVLEQAPSARRAAWLGLVAGVVKSVGGFTWLLATLESYSRMPALVCALFVSLVWLYQGLQLALFAWLYVQARAARVGVLVSAVCALCLAEWSFPEVFPHYFGLSLHRLPHALQIADLGGPLSLSALLISASVALFALLSRFRWARRAELLAALGLWMATLGYGVYRVREVDARAEHALKLELAIIQSNLSAPDKRRRGGENVRSHLAQSVLAMPGPQLFIWPETVVDYDEVDGVPWEMLAHHVDVPVLFGARLIADFENDKPRYLNAARLVNGQGSLQSEYHKQKLLPFGEHMPFADRFPALRELSPRQRRFLQGTRPPLLQLGPIRIGVSICYEDIFAGFIADGVMQTNPQLLVNLTNDAWFGDTREPHQHQALAMLRAVEHHRTLVRATNSGVSAIVDPVGRDTRTSAVFTKDTLRAAVPLLEGQTVYARLGDALGPLSALTLLLAWLRKRVRVGRA
ncbi:MAG: apolipoprotein N-acyltransferase [Polyangiales bacterium]